MGIIEGGVVDGDNIGWSRSGSHVVGINYRLKVKSCNSETSHIF